MFISGGEVPQLYHFGGLRSVVPTELVERIDYFPGNFSARWGRAIGGAVDLDLRSPRRDRIHGSIEVNVFDAGGVLEGPLGKGGFFLAARRSYVDAVIAAAFPSNSGLQLPSPRRSTTTTRRAWSTRSGRASSASSSRAPTIS